MDNGFVILNGKRFHLHAHGPARADPVLMLHGFPEFGGAWDGVAAHLPRWRCLAPDQRGHGQSWAPQDVRDYALRALVDDMVALIDQIGAPVPVVAHDWGAIVAYALAMWFPDTVSRLVVINGAHPGAFQQAVAAGGAQSAASAYIEDLRAPGAESWLAADDFAALRALFGRSMDMGWLTGAEWGRYRREWSRAGVLTGMLNWYRASPLKVARPGQPIAQPHVLPPQAGRIRCPHLVIWGQEDTALLSECLDPLPAYCDDLRIQPVPGADHWICHQKPAPVAGMIEDFLSDTR